MQLTDKSCGVFFLAMGLLFPPFFLVFGGVLNSTNGGYWTSVFAASYVATILIVGMSVYLRVVAERTSAQSSNRSTPKMRWIAASGAALSLFLPLVFFDSGALETTIGMHLFAVAMGAGLSVFIPLGIGMMRRFDPSTSQFK